MDLLQRNELEVRSAEDGLEATAVLKNIFLGIPFGVTEIENSFPVLIRNTAGLGAEAVDEPGEL